MKQRNTACCSALRQENKAHHDLNLPREELYLDALPSIVFLLSGAEAELSLEPAQDVVEGFGAGDEVEGGGERAAVVEVADPQLRASELPLFIRLTL